MTNSIQALVLTTVLLAPSAAMAGELEITPFLGYQFGGDLETFYQGHYGLHLLYKRQHLVRLYFHAMMFLW